MHRSRREEDRRLPIVALRSAPRIKGTTGIWFSRRADVMPWCMDVLYKVVYFSMIGYGVVSSALFSCILI